MPRLARLCPPGIPQHIIQRGNNRCVCFCMETDFAFYAHCLKEYAKEYSVKVHAWAFMTNHVHILATPSAEGAISRMMQSVGRMYVRYFNKTYTRSGTLWEGRFKSCLVDTDRYLLECYKYIELNPVKAKMVDDPADYVWSSYQCNALGKVSELLSPHEVYLSLGSTVEERTAAYRDLFRYNLDKQMITDIREAVNKGLALGSDRFKDQIERMCQRRVTARKAGRPKGC